MSESPNPLAPEHLPWFITAPGQTDGLFVAMIIFLIVVLLLIGVLYFKLHALPEHIAAGTNKVQMEIVAVLAVIALFTHEHIFWIAGLLLALIQLPDFSTPINAMSQSLQRMARGRRAIPEPAIEPAEGATSKAVVEERMAEQRPTLETPPSAEARAAAGLEDAGRA
jgi:hypothetical protein